jgi:acetolactate synthase-1/2/3 large subunit
VKLSDYVVKYLEKYTDHAFIGQGGCVIHLIDSLSKSKIKYTSCHNEQGSAIAAEAYARVSGKLGLAIATSGPGMINLIQGIACAYFDSIPVLFISGQVPTSQLKGDRNVRQLGFQEMDVVSMVKPITKYAVLLKNANDIKEELDKLVRTSFEGRPGPVLLDLPDDLQRTKICGI